MSPTAGSDHQFSRNAICILLTCLSQYPEVFSSSSYVEFNKISWDHKWLLNEMWMELLEQRELFDLLHSLGQWANYVAFPSFSFSICP